MTWTIVTGGNRGIGFEICKKLVEAGKPVLLCSRTLEKGKEAVGQLTKASGTDEDSCRCLALDVSSPSSISEFVDVIASSYDQQVEALVNNAGFCPHAWTEASLREALATNAEGTLQLTQKLVPFMKPGGTIVMVSSTLGLLERMGPNYAGLVTGANSLAELSQMPFVENDPIHSAMVPSYSLSKAVMNRMTQLLATDPLLTSRQLTVNSTCPGWCRTELGGKMSTAAPRSAEQGAQSIMDTLALQAADGRPTGLFYRDGQQLAF